MKTYRSAIYLRLSKEEDGKQESSSIAGQRELLRSFVEEHPEIQITREYSDDGYSGASFDRPAFSQMMDDATAGTIDCILVKDLSRLGRNYIETGRYIERVFPLLGIRFIAVNDSYDSLTEGEAEQLLVPFKNLINDAYCRDISLKIRSHLGVKRRNGECLSSYAVYGYIKDPQDRHRLIVDPDAAEVVRLIYKLKRSGMSCNGIARRLDCLGIPSPLSYKKQSGSSYNCGFHATSTGPLWSKVAVSRILTDETYTGTLVQGKFRKPSHRMRECVMLPKKDWIRVPGTHEAIISKEEFDLIQSLMGRASSIPKGQETSDPFSGFIRCGRCGSNMTRINNGTERYTYYRCQSRRQGKGCGLRLLSEKTLIAAFRSSVASLSDLLRQAIGVLGSEGISSSCSEVRKVHLRSLDREIERLKDIKTGLLQDLRDGVVSREEFMELSSRFSGRISDVQMRRDAFEAVEGEAETNTFSEWIDNVSKLCGSEVIDRPLVALLLEGITVWDKDKIDIRFRFEEQTGELLGQAGLSAEHQHEEDVHTA